MEHFAELIAVHQKMVECYVRFRLPDTADVEDVLQEVCLTACMRFAQLKNQDAFKAWLLSIARSKCTDYFRKRAGRSEISWEGLDGWEPSGGDLFPPENTAVRETMELLDQQDQEILYLSFWEELPQADIARRLGIPLGTVKSRLHNAKRRFKSKYPCPILSRKGDIIMKKLPETMPTYTIEERKDVPFPVQWEELSGWFLIPRLGERLSWGMYDMPSRKRSCTYDMEVMGRASVHGIEGVEICALERDTSGKEDRQIFIAQLTDTRCRYLAAMQTEEGVRRYLTFLDGETFLPNWGFGENNCGREIQLIPRGDIQRTGRVVTCIEKDFLLDITDRCTVTIGGKSYDTIRLMDVDSGSGTATEQFLDQNGRTVLWRRFNRDDWAVDRCGKPWSQLLPENERIEINRETYVHWYDF